MRRPSAASLLILVSGLLVAACSPDSATAPVADAAFAKGAGGGGGGTTVKAGQIQRASFGVVCPLGSSFSGQIDKGFNDRADITLVGVATSLSSTLTSLGGFWSFRITDVDTGALLWGVGTTMGDLTPNFQIKSLGSTVAPGWHSMHFRAFNTRMVDGVSTVVETCDVDFSLFAK